MPCLQRDIVLHAYQCVPFSFARNDDLLKLANIS